MICSSGTKVDKILDFASLATHFYLYYIIHRDMSRINNSFTKLDIAPENIYNNLTIH